MCQLFWARTSRRTGRVSNNRQNTSNFKWTNAASFLSVGTVTSSQITEKWREIGQFCWRVQNFPMFLFIGMQRGCPSIGQLNSVGHLLRDNNYRKIRKFDSGQRKQQNTLQHKHHIKLGVVVPRVNDNGSFS